MPYPTLKQMVFNDALFRFQDDFPDQETSFSNHTFDIPAEKEIKENGYEGAVEQVYQQMVALGETA